MIFLMSCGGLLSRMYTTVLILCSQRAKNDCKSQNPSASAPLIEDTRCILGHAGAVTFQLLHFQQFHNPMDWIRILFVRFGLNST